MRRLLISTVEDARVDRLMIAAHPGARPWLLDSLAAAPAEDDLRVEGFMGRLDHALLDPAFIVRDFWIDKARGLFEAAASTHGLEDAAAFRSVAGRLAHDLGQMRVRADPRQFIVAAPYRDDHSFLWDPGAPEDDPPDPQAVAVSVPVPVTLTTGGGASRGSPDATPSTPSTPLDSETSAGSNPSGASLEPTGTERRPVELGRWRHPEWDAHLERLRPDWCTVIGRRPDWQSAASSPPGASAGSEWGRLRRTGSRGEAQLARMLPALVDGRVRRVQRQREECGDEADLDALICAGVDLRQGLAPDGRVFLSRRHEPAPQALLILLDLSASTDAVAPVADVVPAVQAGQPDAPGGPRATILDLEKRTALALARHAHAAGQRVAIHGFSSDTRHAVDYWHLLDFGDPLDDAALGRLRDVRARHSTRLGAALRHAGSLLKREHARRDLLVITDGAPSDVDVSRPEALIEDARQAALHATRAGVHMHALILDPGADRYARRIFGRRGYRVIDAPAGLLRVGPRSGSD